MSRIVVATERAVAGGSQRTLGLVAPALRDLGWDVQALLGEAGPLADHLSADGIATTVSADADALTDLAPDVVLSMGASGHAWSGRAAAHAEIPAVWWLDLTLRGRPNEGLALGVPALAAATATRAARRALRERAPALRVEVIAPGADWGDVVQHRRAATGARGSIGLAHDDPPLLSMVARLDPIKGQDTAIDAVAALRERRRDVHLALVGGAVVGHEGDLAQRLYQQTQDRGVADLVHHLGFVDDPGPWHSAGALAIQASAHEAFGLSVVEALAHGVPVIASATDGPSEILDGGRYGVLTPPGDADALAQAIADLLDDDARRVRLAASGPGRAAEFTPQAAAQRWNALLRAVLPPGCAPGG
ncbi:MAG: glycosyl transferase group 1 [Ilumatobacteraceae bacterium]|nr:glycosyl transferase group 1 [Ilumatobacteraceae bacterium]